MLAERLSRPWHGRGLRVVDASVFPRIPGFFIASAVHDRAEKAADVILAERGAGDERKRLHDGLAGWPSHLERRIDPFFRPAVDALLREPSARLAQTLLRLIHDAAPDLPVHEQRLPGRGGMLCGRSSPR